MQFLYQADITNEAPDEKQLLALLAEQGASHEIQEFFFDILNGALKHRKSLDEAIKKAAKNWSLTRMALVDRNVLRCAAYELLFRDDIPSKVTLNEAIEIAKKYSTDESHIFINGILNKIAKEHWK